MVRDCCQFIPEYPGHLALSKENQGTATSPTSASNTAVRGATTTQMSSPWRKPPNVIGCPTNTRVLHGGRAGGTRGRHEGAYKPPSPYGTLGAKRYKLGVQGFPTTCRRILRTLASCRGSKQGRAAGRNAQAAFLWTHRQHCSGLKPPSERKGVLARRNRDSLRAIPAIGEGDRHGANSLGRHHLEPGLCPEPPEPGSGCLVRAHRLGNRQRRELLPAGAAGRRPTRVVLSAMGQE